MAKNPKARKPESQKARKPAKPLFREIAASGPSLDLGGFIGEILSPGDPVLKSLGGDLKQYESLMRDDQVGSTFQQRRRAVTSREWDVEPGGTAAADKAAAEFLKEQLEAIKWDRITDKMLYGTFYGYSVAECLWARDGNRIVIDTIKVKRRRRFKFDRDFNLRLITRAEPRGLVMPPRKFWTFNVGGEDDEDPYGRGLAFWLYWPVFLKRNGVKFWAIALEKFGMPTGKGTYPSGATDDEKKALLEAVAAVGTDAAVIIPDGMMIELIEAQRRSGGDHAVFARYLDGAVSKIILSQTMTTDDGSSRSQSETHMEVRDEVIKADADLINESFNDGPGTWLTEWNFPGAKPPIVYRIIEEPEDLKVAAERDKTVHDMGFKPSLDYVNEKYGPGWEQRQGGDPRQTAPGPQPPPDPAFAASREDAVEALIDDLVASGHLGDAMADITAPLEKLLADSASFEEARETLAGAIAGMDPEKVGELLAQALFAADLAGQTNVDLETGEDLDARPNAED